MPELPDVETMRRYLEATSLYQEIEKVDVRAPILLADDRTSDSRAGERVEEVLVGRSFVATRRHGKYLSVTLDGEADGDEQALLLHFGMTGGLKYFKEMEGEPKYDRVLFSFKNGYHLAYVSQRKLGQIGVVNDVSSFLETKDLGPDALDPALDFQAFKEAVRDRRAMAKSVLMDQGTVAGIGNVYSDEILFQAGIYPRTRMDELSDEELKQLFQHMKDVLETATAAQADPERFSDLYVAPHRHEGGTCPVCGATLRTVKVSSRTSYFCPECQAKAC